MQLARDLVLAGDGRMEGVAESPPIGRGTQVGKVGRALRPIPAPVPRKGHHRPAAAANGTRPDREANVAKVQSCTGVHKRRRSQV